MDLTLDRYTCCTFKVFALLYPTEENMPAYHLTSSLLLGVLLNVAYGFLPASHHSSMQRSKVIIDSTSDVDYNMPTQCFIVNQELVDTEGEEPEIVCTNAPDDYAWFNGLDADAFVPTDGTSEESWECVEGESPRGIPEWECHSTLRP